MFMKNNTYSESSNFIETLQKRTGLMVSYSEETAYDRSFISKDQRAKLAEPLSKNAYGLYLMKLTK